MIRLFNEPTGRTQKELESFWKFVREDGKQSSLPVPGCWEQHPGTGSEYCFPSSLTNFQKLSSSFCFLTVCSLNNRIIFLLLQIFLTAYASDFSVLLYSEVTLPLMTSALIYRQPDCTNKTLSHPLIPHKN